MITTDFVQTKQLRPMNLDMFSLILSVMLVQTALGQDPTDVYVWRSGGRVKPGSICSFPFTYDEVEYTTCTDVNHDAFWCATIVPYNSRGWGECEPRYNCK